MSFSFIWLLIVFAFNFTIWNNRTNFFSHFELIFKLLNQLALRDMEMIYTQKCMVIIMKNKHLHFYRISKCNIFMYNLIHFCTRECVWHSHTLNVHCTGIKDAFKELTAAWIGSHKIEMQKNIKLWLTQDTFKK